VEPLLPRRFEALVVDTLDSLPPELASLIDNVVVTVEDRGDPPGLLGMYEGVPLTERGDYGTGGFVMPDRIHIYRLALCEFSEDEKQLRAEVIKTVIHEVAHHFGIDDHRLTALGWD